MSRMLLTAIGVSAALLTTGSWLPQLRRAWDTRSTGDISWGYLLAFGAGVALWLVYGLMLRDLAIVLANGITVAAIAFLVVLKATFDRADRLAVDAVLLDMDGTLVDSDAAVERAWTSWAREYGVDPAVVHPVMHGNTPHVTARAVAPHLSESEVAIAAARQLVLQHGDVDGVVRGAGGDVLLDWLAANDVPWAVVTTADRRIARERLAAAGIDPPVLVTFDDVTSGKPDPEGYLRAAELLGVRAERCLVVEDSAAGIAAGRAAGALVAGLRGADADLAVRDLAEVAGLLASVARD